MQRSATAGLAGAVVAANLAGLLAVPFLPGPGLLLLVPFVLLAPAQWGLVHEAIHGLLLASARWDRACGRTLAALLGFSFDLVRFGHLMHHAETGHHLDRPDKGRRGGLAGPWSVLRHYGHLLGGHYVVTCAFGLGAFLPWRVTRPLLRAGFAGEGEAAANLREAATRWFSQGRRRAAIRVDVLGGWGVIGFSLWLSGSAWPFLAAALYGRGLLISLMDNMPHYGTQGSSDADIPVFRLPRWLSLPLMNHHLHRLHHERPALPWTELPHLFEQTSSDYDIGYGAGMLRQLRGPNWT